MIDLAWRSQSADDSEGTNIKNLLQRKYNLKGHLMTMSKKEQRNFTSMLVTAQGMSISGLKVILCRKEAMHFWARSAFEQALTEKRSRRSHQR